MASAPARVVLNATGMSHPFRTGVLMVVVGLVVIGHVAVARAQNADAEALFTEADALEAAGKLDEACDVFEASNRIEPRAGTMIRLGACREAQGRLASAWSAYKDALTRVKDQRKRQVAEQRVAALESRLSYLIVSVPDESRVDGLTIQRNGAALDPGLWNRAAPVDGGTYVIEGAAPGHEPWRTTVEVDQADDRAAVEVPRFKVLRVLAVTPEVLADERDDRPPPPRGMGSRRRVAIGAGAVGAAALIAGGVLGMQARGLERDAYDLCPDPAAPCAEAARAEELLDRGGSRALMANVALGTGAVAIAGATVLWLTSGRESRPAAVSIVPRASARAAALDVTWRF